MGPTGDRQVGIVAGDSPVDLQPPQVYICCCCGGGGGGEGARALHLHATTVSNEMAGAARASPLLGFFLALVAAHVPLPVRAQDTVAAGRPLSGDAKLVSRGGKFALGFFQPGIYHTYARVVPNHYH
jgi:hypothetical protein